tara:strand:- start:36 stop:635 length:600 start_codon:yes stop_codon:yes gene_type:complete
MRKIESREEFKLVFGVSEFNTFLSSNIKDLTKLFTGRKIKSLYFDTINFDIYKNQLLYDVDKFKIRIRSYNNLPSFTKEIKENTSQGKIKISEKLDIESFDDIEEIFYLGKIYYPTIFVSYNRDYFKYKDARITIDTDIQYQASINRKLDISIEESKHVVVEYKKYNKHSKNIINYLDRPYDQFSKYQEAIEKIFPNIL